MLDSRTAVVAGIHSAVYVCDTRREAVGREVTLNSAQNPAERPSAEQRPGLRGPPRSSLEASP